MKDIFLICTVRNANEEQKQKINRYIEKLVSSGKTIYYPAKDTNQTDDIGYRICSDNKKAIKEAKEIHIFWDKNSQGSLFDIGVAFALDKKLVIANPEDIEETETKSFSNMVLYWSQIDND